MIEPASAALLDFPVMCQAQVDLPAWLARLTRQAGWKLSHEGDGELCDSYVFRNRASEALVTLYHSGYALIEVDGAVLYDDPLAAAPDVAVMQYFNAESGAPLYLN